VTDPTLAELVKAQKVAYAKVIADRDEIAKRTAELRIFGDKVLTNIMELQEITKELEERERQEKA
jgi:hypothetical protein